MRALSLRLTKEKCLSFFIHVYNSRILPSPPIPCAEQSVWYSGENPGEDRWVHKLPPRHGSRHHDSRFNQPNFISKLKRNKDIRTSHAQNVLHTTFNVCASGYSWIINPNLVEGRIWIKEIYVSTLFQRNRMRHTHTVHYLFVCINKYNSSSRGTSSGRVLNYRARWFCPGPDFEGTLWAPWNRTSTIGYTFSYQG